MTDSPGQSERRQMTDQNQQPKAPSASVPAGQMLIYRTEDGRLKVEARLDNETLWLTQQQMAELFQTSKQNISLHLQNIFEEQELVEISVIKDYLTTAADGKKLPHQALQPGRDSFSGLQGEKCRGHELSYLV
jgi:hypothetical protein